MNQQDVEQLERMLTVSKEEADRARQVIEDYRASADKYLQDVSRIALRDPGGAPLPEMALLALGEIRGLLRPLAVALKKVDLYEEGQRQLHAVRKMAANRD